MDSKTYYSTLGDKCGRDTGPRAEVVAGMIPGRGLSILDVGCGDGKLSATYGKQSNRVTGIDINQETLRAAEERIDRVHRIDLDRRWDPLKDDSFDMIVMSAVVEHVFNYENVFSEAARVLKTGGTMIIATPNAASLRGRIELFCGAVPSWFKNFEHIRLWTRSWLKSRVAVHGFNEVSFTGCFVKTSPVLNRMAGLFPTLAPIIIGRYRLIKKHHPSG